MIAKAYPQYSLNNRSTLVAISGSGNVAQYTALKVIELGATVVSLSDSKGSLIANGEGGFTADVVETIAKLKLKGGSLNSLTFSADQKYTYHAGEYLPPSTIRPFEVVRNMLLTILRFISDQQVNALGRFFQKFTSHCRVLPRTKSPPKRRRHSSKLASRLSRKVPTWYTQVSLLNSSVN